MLSLTDAPEDEIARILTDAERKKQGDKDTQPPATNPTEKTVDIPQDPIRP